MDYMPLNYESDVQDPDPMPTVDGTVIMHDLSVETCPPIPLQVIKRLTSTHASSVELALLKDVIQRSEKRSKITEHPESVLEVMVIWTNGKPMQGMGRLAVPQGYGDG